MEKLRKRQCSWAEEGRAARPARQEKCNEAPRLPCWLPRDATDWQRADNVRNDKKGVITLQKEAVENREERGREKGYQCYQNVLESLQRKRK